ncbi:MAG: GlcG/HbpS family heme-binding protein [Methyloligella sp. ZOD6]
MHVTLEHAQQAIEAARKKAKDLDLKMCIAVVDSGGNLKAFERMDDAWVGSIDIAFKKAKTACFFGMATGELGKLSQPGKPLYGIEVSNDGLVTFPGGVPIVDEDGYLVGAVGASGSTVENDHTVAEAAVKVLGVTELPEHPWRT